MAKVLKAMKFAKRELILFAVIWVLMGFITISFDPLHIPSVYSLLAKILYWSAGFGFFCQIVYLSYKDIQKG